MSEKIKVIYVSGIGRSGSTLVDMLLSTSNQVDSVGEIYKYNRLMEVANCACGKHVKECRFWQVVKDNDVNIVNRYTIKNYLKMLGIIFLPFLKLKFTGGDNYKLFSNVKKNINEGNYILDSSKDPARLIELIQNENIEIYNISIIRDPRLVAKSFADNKQKPQGAKGKNFIITTLKWIFINFIIWIIPYRFKINSKTVIYENLCSDYESFKKEMEEYLDISIPENYIDTVRTMEYHQVGGNRLRLKEHRENFNGVIYDSSRRQKLGKIKQYIILTISFPFFYFWIYRKSK